MGATFKEKGPREVTRGFKALIIARGVWLEEKLSLQEKVFLAEIDSLDSDDMGCYANNSYFAKFFGISTRRVQQILHTLAKKGLISLEVNKAQGNARTIKILTKQVSLDPYERSCAPSRNILRGPHEIHFASHNKEENVFNNINIREYNTQEHISFSFETGSFEKITPKQIQIWSEAYPAVDIELAIKQAAQWLLSNPKKAKSNYRRFLTNWFARQQERGGTKGGIPNVRKYRDNTTYQQHDPAAIEL